MFYGLVYFPDIDTEKIDRFRKKYDPAYELKHLGTISFYWF